MVNNTIKLDAYDRRILYELDANARISTTNIGRKIRKSKQFVDYRISKLTDAGILRGYVTVVDYSKLGYQSIRVYLKFHNITREKQDKIENELIKDSEVWWLVTLEGLWDVGYAVAVKNILDFYEYWDKIQAKYRQYIKKRSVVIYTHIEQYPKTYLVKQKNTDKKTRVGGSGETVQITDKDLQTLKLLAEHGKMPLLNLAKNLNTSPQVIRSRMNRLEKEGVIEGYRALIDVSSLGYRYYKSYLNFLNTDRLSELRQYCSDHPNILTTNRSIGGSDFEIELQAKNFDEFDEIMSALRARFEGMIDDYEFVIAREEKKMVYFPFQ